MTCISTSLLHKCTGKSTNFLFFCNDRTGRKGQSSRAAELGFTTDLVFFSFAVIEEANWLTLDTEVVPPVGGFDALICMGNSFAHLPDEFGDQRQHVAAVQNFYKLIKPGGILVIDHRNYDYILDHGHAPKKNIYYNVGLRFDL